MERIKNWIGNTPLFIGLGMLYVASAFKKVSDKLFDLSFLTHEALNTEMGKKIKEVKEQMKAMVAAMKANAEDNKLSKVFSQQDDLPNGVLQIGKKPTTDN